MEQAPVQRVLWLGLTIQRGLVPGKVVNSPFGYGTWCDLRVSVLGNRGTYPQRQSTVSSELWDEQSRQENCSCVAPYLPVVRIEVFLAAAAVLAIAIRPLMSSGLGRNILAAPEGRFSGAGSPLFAVSGMSTAAPGLFPEEPGALRSCAVCSASCLGCPRRPPRVASPRFGKSRTSTLSRISRLWG